MQNDVNFFLELDSLKTEITYLEKELCYKYKLQKQRIQDKTDMTFLLQNVYVKSEVCPENTTPTKFDIYIKFKKNIFGVYKIGIFASKKYITVDFKPSRSDYKVEINDFNHSNLISYYEALLHIKASSLNSDWSKEKISSFKLNNRI